MQMNVLIISHGHPSSNAGGSEIAAYELFNQLKSMKNIKSHFLSINSNSSPLNQARFHFNGAEESNEYCLKSTSHPFSYVNQDPKNFQEKLFLLLEDINPDIVHFLHFLHIGVDTIKAIKNHTPSVKICLTLHDFRALCLNDGLMLTNKKHRCLQSTVESCQQCAPHRSTGEIHQRHQTLRSFLSQCDVLISPSQFLIDLFRSNAIDHPNIRKIKNGIKYKFQSLGTSTRLNRFGFFGKTTEAKGLLLFLKAVFELNQKTNKCFAIDIFGDGLEQQPAAFQHRVNSLLGSEAAKNISWHGGYQSRDIPELMARVDWVVIPSIWWENSPLVIQEAFAHSRPVIGSDIGGIAENIRGRGGLTFRAGDAEDLASVMAKAIGDYNMFRTLLKMMTAPISSKQSAEEHIALYQELLYSDG